MAIDTVESPSPSQSLSSSHFSSARHYYVAVDRLQFKMETLVDLLGVAGRRPSLPIVLCCSSRDELDAVCSTIANLPYISLTSLYSDLAEAERASILEKFRQATLEWNQNITVHPEDEYETGNQEPKSHMIVVTDACLPVLAAGEAPISARILINYELPTKKEMYLRRISTCLAADGIVMNMVVGGEVVTLKGIEEGSGLVIAEMPINISEIL
ncbi:ATP-dependent RNA helicase fal1 [Magnolia sinica]|uniref:ATP-dependent RNA helicase fal1 n=1 Tax=Magnolia sinica TaxID=86752 RepID=UPI0026588D5C|nr:ATP-dependent RNA helicase fal1 [Magnolia sinica]